MFGGFSATKLKPQLKMAVSRFQIASNKKTALMKQQMREIAVMLAEDPPREEKARIRAEALIREDNAVEAFEILQLECELLAERIKLIDSTRECPPDLVSCISTVMWACNRVDIPELTLIKKQFRAKYGKIFEERAMNNVGGVLNDRVVSKLSVQPPAAYLIQVYLERICEQYEVDWKPRVRISAEEAAEPMSAPVGFSVPVAGASGLIVPGQALEPTKTNEPPSVTATPVIPATTFAPPAPFVPTKTEDFQEVDIYVPPVPSAPPVMDNNKQDDDDDDDDDLPPPPSDGGSSSYRDLAARFEQLRK